MSRERAMAAYVDEKFQPNPLKKKKKLVRLRQSHLAERAKLETKS